MAMMEEPKSTCEECGNDYATGYCLHKDPDAGTTPSFLKNKTEPLRAGMYNRFPIELGIGKLTMHPWAENDAPEKGQGNLPELRKQIKDYTTNFYGPSRCAGCGKYDVVRSEMNTNYPVTSWEESEGENGPTYTPHHCTHIGLFKSLAGKVLTVIDASLTTNPKQHKAVVDLLRKAFAETISRARELEGDNTNEAIPREELA